ncbi:MAG: hypothetical protein Q8Q18_01550 [bacterium]|nr:hypothetical protein [bacterium]
MNKLTWIVVVLVLVGGGYMYINRGADTDNAMMDAEITENNGVSEEEAMVALQQGFAYAPAEMRVCLDTELGADTVNEVIAGTFIMTPTASELFKVSIEKCLNALPLPEGAQINAAQ